MLRIKRRKRRKRRKGRELTAASTLNAEIGYGNAAGLLFTKGISAPPPGKIIEVDDETNPPAGRVISADTRPLDVSADTTFPSSVPRHPITALEDFEDVKSALENMTEEEKEREAERLFGVFDRMDKNPVISARGPDGKEKGVKSALQEKYVEKEQEWEEKEARERREEEERDEAEALRDLEAYKRRTRGKGQGGGG